MANFRTHLAVGTISTGLLATMAMAASVVNTNQVVMLTMAGAFGSILPDIDLERSKSSRGIFFGLALFLAFTFLFAIGWKFSILEMWLIWIAVFLSIRYVGQAIFHRFAVHRGIFHSLLAGVFFMFATAAIFKHVYASTEFISWMAGLFVLFGYIVHLALDELYSVDFDNTRIKKSFGTALKIFEYRSTGASLAMALATVGIYYLTPSYEALELIFTSKKEWAQIWGNMLPNGVPFDLDVALENFAAYLNAEPGQISNSVTNQAPPQNPTGSLPNQ